MGYGRKSVPQSWRDKHRRKYNWNHSKKPTGKCRWSGKCDEDGLPPGAVYCAEHKYVAAKGREIRRASELLQEKVDANIPTAFDYSAKAVRPTRSLRESHPTLADVKVTIREASRQLEPEYEAKRREDEPEATYEPRSTKKVIEVQPARASSPEEVDQLKNEKQDNEP